MFQLLLTAVLAGNQPQKGGGGGCVLTDSLLDQTRARLRVETGADTVVVPNSSGPPSGAHLRKPLKMGPVSRRRGGAHFDCQLANPGGFHVDQPSSQLFVIFLFWDSRSPLPSLPAPLSSLGGSCGLGKDSGALGRGSV